MRYNDITPPKIVEGAGSLIGYLNPDFTVEQLTAWFGQPKSNPPKTQYEFRISPGIYVYDYKGDKWHIGGRFGIKDYLRARDILYDKLGRKPTNSDIWRLT